MNSKVTKIALFFLLFIFTCHLRLTTCDLSAEDIDIKYNSDKGIFTMPFGRSYDYSNIVVTRAVDGDTLLLENGERVRLIGIDTPELHQSAKLLRDSERTKEDAGGIQKLGQRAHEFTKKLVEGKPVSLEFDVEKYDKYNRLLAYAYLKDGTFINAEIVKQGYASLMTIPPNVKYAQFFNELYKEARESQRGLWK